MTKGETVKLLTDYLGRCDELLGGGGQRCDLRKRHEGYHHARIEVTWAYDEAGQVFGGFMAGATPMSIRPGVRGE